MEEHAASDNIGDARNRRRTVRPPSREEIEAFRSAAGSWADVDTDKLIEPIYEARRRSIRPPVKL